MKVDFTKKNEYQAIAPLLGFTVVAFLAGRDRILNYFPQKPNGLLVCALASGLIAANVAGVYGDDAKCKMPALKRRVLTVVGIAAGSPIMPIVAKKLWNVKTPNNGYGRFFFAEFLAFVLLEIVGKCLFVKKEPPKYTPPSTAVEEPSREEGQGLPASLPTVVSKEKSEGEKEVGKPSEAEKTFLEHRERIDKLPPTPTPVPLGPAAKTPFRGPMAMLMGRSTVESKE